MQSKLDLLRSRAISMFLYACESWTMNARERFELNCFRRLPNIHYTSHTTNIRVRELVTQHLGRQDSLLSVATKRKLTWFNHVVRTNGTLANIILQGAVEGTKERGRPKSIWMNDIKNT